LHAIVLAAEPVRIRDLSKRVPKQAAAVPSTSGKAVIIGLTEGLSLVATAIVAVAFQRIRHRQRASPIDLSTRSKRRRVRSSRGSPSMSEYLGEDVVIQMWRLFGRLIHEFERAA
jgi:hypothetical protein